MKSTKGQFLPQVLPVTKYATDHTCLYTFTNDFEKITKQTLYIQRNIKERSRNHCCRGKVMSYICVCVRACTHARARACSLAYPVCKAHDPYYIAICGLSGFTTLFHIISQTARFSKKKKKGIEHKMCVLNFSTNLSKTFLILKRTQRDIVINVKTSSRKVPTVLVRF
jgi:hypothetical protein